MNGKKTEQNGRKWESRWRICEFALFEKNKDIWVWTGYRLEDELIGGIANTEVTYELLSYIDVLVEGRFVESLKDSTLKWRGSSNQRILYPKKLLNNLV